ncbi:MAG: hypothetical protein CVU03_13395 [Bacteroidetes bacterium HGW-Bacteroidetes-2]|jgi:hypothetical protein|nr:MAG: hypothetical protein CVU03_13395 [Bacteroidetes bacterium HGW-Bacteroidetes-2]
MNNDKWNEICFLLSENIKSDISENSFEQNVIQALRVLGWKQFSGDFEIRPSYQIGAANRITPDFVIKSSDNHKLFVIEIKQPNIPLTSTFQQQLFSYMRQLKLEYGILIGQGIQIFYDGNLAEQEDPVLLETIRFEKNSEKGENFVQIFSKENFNTELLKEFTLNALKKINRKEEFKRLKSKILSDNYKDKLNELIKQDFISEYDGELIASVLTELRIEIIEKNIPINNSKTQIKQYSQPKEFNHSSTILPIELNPSGEDEFKRKLLLTKKAYITTFYANGTNEKKPWTANSFRESSGVIGNLRSRPEFRNGEWQKRGIIKVFVSINE